MRTNEAPAGVGFGPGLNVAEGGSGLERQSGFGAGAFAAPQRLYVYDATSDGERFDLDHLYGSAAGAAHVPRDGRRRSSGYSEVMAFRLAGQKALQRLVDRSAPARPDQVPELDLLIMPETAIDRPRRRDPDPVATLAEIAGKGGYETKAHRQPPDVIITRWATRSAQ